MRQKIQIKLSSLINHLKSLNKNDKKALLFIIAFVVLGIIGSVGFHTTSSANSAELAKEKAKIVAESMEQQEPEVKLSQEGEELIGLLDDTINSSSLTCESVQKVIPNTSFDIQSSKIDQLLTSLSGSYELTQQFGSEYKMADTPLNQKVTKTPTAEQIEINIGSLTYNILFNYDNAYISKDCFLSILERTDENYQTLENGAKRVLSTYSWVKTPLVSKSSISRFTVNIDEARRNLKDVTKDVEYIDIEQSDGTVQKVETGNVTYTASYKDEYVTSLIADKLGDDILNNGVEQELKLEVRADSGEIIITRKIVLPDIMQYIEEYKYKSSDNQVNVTIPSDDIVYDATSITKLGDISSNNIKQFSIGERQEGLLVDNTESYDSVIPISSYPSITLSPKKTEQGEEFQSFFNAVAKQISDLVASYGDFSATEPKVDKTSGSLYYNIFNTDANISLHYYSSCSSYQTLTLSITANKGYFDSEDNLGTACTLFEKYTGIKITSDNIKSLIDTGISSKENGVTLVDGDYQLKAVKGTDYDKDDSKSISVEAIISVKEDSKA